MKREEVRAWIREFGIIPALRVKSQEQALFAAETVNAAGIPIVEITLTTPGVFELIADLAGRYPKMAVGAGTVLDEEMARKAIDAGARFITSPGFIPEVVNFARQAETVVFPGAMTPSEVIAAWKAGSDFVKIYPASAVGGVPYVRSLANALPQIPLIITGGVTQLTAREYIAAGATAFGVGSELFPREALELCQARRIHELARRFLNSVKEGRTMQGNCS